jgi:hypothetical protein
MLFFCLIVCLAVNSVVVVADGTLTSSSDLKLLTGKFGEKGYSGDLSAATDAQLRAPWSIWGDQRSRLFFSDPQSHTIRYVSTFDGKIRRFAGNVDIPGPATIGLYSTIPLPNIHFNRPHGIYGRTSGSFSGLLWVCDTMNHVIRQFALGGAFIPYGIIGKVSFLLVSIVLFNFLFSWSEWIARL